jgi:hypothetical protein
MSDVQAIEMKRQGLMSRTIVNLLLDATLLMAFCVLLVSGSHRAIRLSARPGGPGMVATTLFMENCQ